MEEEDTTSMPAQTPVFAQDDTALDPLNGVDLDLEEDGEDEYEDEDGEDEDFLDYADEEEDEYADAEDEEEN